MLVKGATGVMERSLQVPSLVIMRLVIGIDTLIFDQSGVTSDWGISPHPVVKPRVW